jgi:retron-type reverse transcriptase
MPANIHGLPLIRSLSDLQTLTGTPTHRLWLFLARNGSSYEEFRIPKKTGGYRFISHPHPLLKCVQKWILRNILDGLSTTESSYGFEPGSRVIEHAKQHAHAKAILSIDIEDFFASIGAARVTNIFRLAGYSSKSAGILARLCTHKGSLPQGAPSSPRLANLACYRLDRRLAHLAATKGIVYTRYADDMSFSGSSARTLAKLYPLIRHIVSDCGFTLNSRKSRLAGPSSSLRVTGLVISLGQVGIGRRRFRELRVRIHRIHTGLAESELARTQGLLDYIWDVDQRRYANLTKYVQKLLRTTPETALTGLRLRESA